MTTTLITFQIDDGIARLVLNRPDKRNALSREVIAQLAAAMKTVAADNTVRLLVLAAEGSVFCAGMDLGEMQQRAAEPNSSAEWKKDTQVYRDLLADIVSLPIPTLAVVQGPALAGGVGLVLACDMVLATETAFFALPEPKRGITAAVVAPLLIHRIGVGRAGYMLLSGQNVSAVDARQMGLCHEVVAADNLEHREKELSQSILTGAPQALAKTKQHIHAMAAATLLAQLDAGMKVSAEARETDDAREGLAAFLEKRSPNWAGENS